MFKFCVEVIPLPKNYLFSRIYGRSGNAILQSRTYYYKHVDEQQMEWPETRKLKILEKEPFYGPVKPPRMMKMKRLMRGPEEVHTDFLYKGFGVKALLGGRLKYEHFDFIRNSVNKNLDEKRMFALWRVDPPWQPVSKRGIGKRMGGGKGGIHHYVTPVKAGRVIVELGGDLLELEAKKILVPIAISLPFPARFYSQKDIEEERKNEKWVNENNLNPYTMEYVIRNNMGGCGNWLSKNDYKWFGRYK